MIATTGPDAALPAAQTLRISVNLPARSHGPVATVQVFHRNGAVNIRQFGLNARGNGARIVHFSTASIRKVVVVLTNGSTAMVACRKSKDPYRCGGRGRFDDQTYRVDAHLS